MSVLSSAAPGSSPPHLPRYPGLPLLGNLFDGWSDPLALFVRGEREVGPDVHYRFLHLDYLLLTRPESAQHVLVAHPERYPKSENYEGLRTVLGHGLLTSEGSFWRRQRKLIQPSFHREKLAGLVDTMAEATDAFVERLQREHGDGGIFDLHEEFMRLTFRIVGLTLLSRDLDADAKSVGEALTVALFWANDRMDSLIRPPLWWPSPNNLRFARAKKVLDELVLRIVAERRAETEASRQSRRTDLLDMLLAMRTEEGDAMSDQQILHELLTLVLAGHETTASALSFTWFLLARHPESLARVREEAEQCFGDEKPSVEALKRLPYTTAVIEEAMRLYPPAWVFERQATQDDVIGGVPVRKGSIVGLSPFVVQRSALHWTEPEHFDPERFLPPRRAQIGKHTYMPFGGGQRFCIGNNFALMEMQLVVAMLARRCGFEVAADFEPELGAQVTLRPSRGIPARLRRAG